MNKQLIWVVLALFAVVGLLIGCGPDPLAGITGKTVRINNGTPEIDGVMDDIWNDADCNAIDMVNWDKNPEVPSASGCFRVLWDDAFVYVWAVVKDSTWDDPKRNAAHERDTLEMYIDENYSHGENYDEDDSQYRLNVDGDITGYGAYDPEAAVGVFTRTDDGYTVEFAMPFQFSIPIPNQLVGLDFQINDCKGNGTRDAVICWNQDDDSAWSRSSKFGTGLLLE